MKNTPAALGWLSSNAQNRLCFPARSHTARIQEFREHDRQVDVAGDTAVISFRYDMVYERAGERYRATGRDLWVFQQQDAEWIAVWRTMLDMEEKSS